MWLFFIPILVILTIFVIVISVNYWLGSKTEDYQNLVGMSCIIHNDITSNIDSTLVKLEKEFKVLNISTYGGKIKQSTKVLLVKYEPDSNSYKAERYE